MGAIFRKNGPRGMHDHRRISVTIMLAALLFFSTVLTARDVSADQGGGLGWSSAQGNPQDNGLSEYVTDIDHPGSQNVIDLPPGAYCSKLMASPDGTVYAYLSSGQLFAYTSTGEIRWSIALPGVQSMVVNGNESIIYGKNNAVGAISGSSGDIIWERSLGNSSLSNTHIMLFGVGGTVLVPTNDSLIEMDKNGTVGWTRNYSNASIAIGLDGNIIVLLVESDSLVSLDPNGTVCWRRDDIAIVPGGLDMYPIGPVINIDGTILINLRNSISAWSPDGLNNWTYPLQSDERADHIVVDANGNIITTIWSFMEGVSSPGSLISLDKNGNLRWKTDHPLGPMAVSNNSIIYGMLLEWPAKLIAIDSNGSMIWEKPLLHSPSPLDTYYQFMFGLIIGPDGVVYFTGMYPLQYDEHKVRTYPADPTQNFYILGLSGVPPRGDDGSWAQGVITAGCIVLVSCLVAVCYFVRRMEIRKGGE